MTVVVEGVLKADDTVELASHPALPPGPVRVRLEALADQGMKLLPDPPWPDETIPAPCDLSLPGTPARVVARKVSALLPEPFEPTEKDLRP